MDRDTIKINIPESAAEILNKLHEAGFEAYVVGGCVRDSILGREPGDWDITTSARPEQVKKIFGRTIDTGIQHGTVTVMMGKEGFEVTTYRIDGEYEDGRHPKDVTFTSNLVEDLKRRDFTINAMAYSDRDGLIDEFDGLIDIEKKIIRCVGEPRERFTEDALRMMRAVRFAAQLGYSIEEDTKKAITELAPTLDRISAERIQVELVKLLTSDNPGKVRELYETGLSAVFMPEFDRCFDTPQNNPHHAYNVGEHIVKSIEAVKNDKILRISMLFHDIEKPSCRVTDSEGMDHFYTHEEKSAKTAGAILRRLKFDRDTMDKVEKLIRYHDLRFPAEKRNVRRAVNKISDELFPYFIEIKKADTSAQSDYRRDEKYDWIQKIADLYDEIKKNGECFCLKDLAVNGKDLIDRGIKPGRELGDILSAMLSDVLDDPSHNTKEYLLNETNFARYTMKGNE